MGIDEEICHNVCQRTPTRKPRQIEAWSKNHNVEAYEYTKIVLLHTCSWWLKRSILSPAASQYAVQSANSAHLRQTSKMARTMRGALFATYIMSAMSEKLSTRARLTKAWRHTSDGCN